MVMVVVMVVVVVVVVVVTTSPPKVVVCLGWVVALAAMERLAELCDRLPWDQDTFDKLTRFLHR